MEVRERLSLNRYLDNLADPQVAFGVKQGRPETVDAAITATLQMELYKISAQMSTRTAYAHTEEEPPPTLPRKATTKRVVGAV